MYEESRSVPFAIALYAGAAVQLGLVYWVPDARWILAGAAVLLATLGFVGSRYSVRFDGATIQFGFRCWNRSLQCRELRSARAERIGLWTFGGAGWRVGRGKIGYVRWFGPAVAIATAEREYWFSCEHPDALLKELRRAGVSEPRNV